MHWILSLDGSCENETEQGSLWKAKESETSEVITTQQEIYDIPTWKLN